jgi:serine/threonine protein kinase
MSAPELVAGYVVAGKYAIRSLLRHGGAMASYRASGPKNRDVVLKICDPALSSQPAVLQTIAQYQSICAKLPPQLVISIFDSGTDPNSGAPYFVSEFESRPTLAQCVERDPLSVADMASLIRNLARATDSLHASGIAGLTLHPSNVFVTPGTQEVRVADFAAGLVRHALALPPEKAARYLPWLAPEQIKAQAPPARSSDVFALGLLAFFAITGKSYWRSVQTKSSDPAALRREILGERMPASVRASEYAVTLNPAVDAVFGRALGFRAADRFGTAGEFAAGLSAAMLGDAADDTEATARFSGSELLASIPVAADSGLDAANNLRRKAPPPRKMPDRGTMLGMGAPAAQAATGALAQAPAARPPLGTMMGIGERGAADAPPPAAPIASAPKDPRKAVPPPMAAQAPAKAGPPPMPAPAADAGPRPVQAPLTKGGSLPKTTMLGMAPQANAAVQAARNAPEKPLGGTMMGYAAPPSTAQAPLAAPERSLAGTMMGYAPPPASSQSAPEKTLSPARVAAPALPTSPPNAFLTPATPHPAAARMPPPMPAASPTNTPPGSPALPKYAEPPSPAAQQREAPAAFAMAPPPAEIAQVLANFEAVPFVPNAASSQASPGASPVDVAIAGPAWSGSAAAPIADGVETDVAMVGADVFAPPNRSKRARVLLLAGIGGFLLVSAGVALALSGGSSSKDAASKSKTSASAEIAAQEAPHVPPPEQPVVVEPPPPAPPEPEVAAVAPPEAPAAVAPAAPPPAEQAAAEPAAPKNEPAAPAAPRATSTGSAASKKPCGKFLKRCK